MKENYSFLKDNSALTEIRKHKWIESEKLGHELGFASAAIDWVKKYGASWKQNRFQDKNNPLQEKRRYRRFNQRFPIQLTVNDSNIACFTDNFNLLGLSCTIPDFIPSNTNAKVTIRFQKSGIPQIKSHFHFESRISRVSHSQRLRSGRSHNIFVPFSKEVREFVQQHAETLCN
ncbi:MAG: hypothetical protein KAR05_09425 [Candidatus Omnitrophica bacterium]|nr:hypothetical protein [Candidatus Omnitrophota bacterium]